VLDNRAVEQEDLNRPQDLNLLRPWREPVPRSRLLADTLGSSLFHLVLVVILLNLPSGPAPVATPPVVDLRKATPLYLPRELTQKDPNKGPISHSLDVRSAMAPAPVVRRFRPPAPAGPGTPAPPAPPPSIEPPKIEVAQALPAPPLTTTLPPPPEKPKVALENVNPVPPPPPPAKNPVIPLPKTSVEEATRAASVRSGGGGVVVDDAGAGPARLRDYELLSDPLGVDFKPYLIQVVAAVRRNWMAVIPESGRMGRRGLVQLQFSIDRQGRVPKLVIATASGTEAFDRAAVAGVSASNPFPPLPSDYKGDQIRLQLSFAYNIPSR
jgi:TonB family protein